MEPILRPDIPSGDAWIHQIKWDGIRGLTYIDQTGIRLYTKKGKERTEFYPELQQLSKLVEGDSMILDGEIVVLNDEHKPSFELVLTRERVRTTEKIPFYVKKYPIKYILFDILFLNGKNLTKRALIERKNLLLQSVHQNETIAITDDFKDGIKLFSLMREKGWEGIVSKHLDSAYIGGKNHKEWFKVKLQRKMLVVVGGVSWKNEFPNSLLLGVYRKDRLLFIGKASLGLKESDFQMIKEFVPQLMQNHSPFYQLPTKIKDVTWIKPALTCWVQFLEWTNDGQLRHPKILGFSPYSPYQAIGKDYVM
ncbi:bifunctional non-homologous end joining protein LigD [Tepidibacillus fermentans]|uniref:DNA ligase (ATP) n=2 Tax=Tepidibacillus fermentans TaxID=1281767 RepID=A0A4R3KMK0_9BACI|nr:bifunctional non-homologous end joining protein LigD [Tepidibacillus fermentans]